MRKIIVVLMSVAILSGCAKDSTQTKKVHFDNYEIFEAIELQDEKQIQVISTYEKELSSLAKIQVIEIEDNIATCEITAPDVHDIIISYMDEKTEFATEQDLYEDLYRQATDRKCKKRKQTIVIDIVENNGEWYAKTSSIKYRDAVTGGLYSALSEINKNLALEYLSIIEEELK